MTTPTDNSRTSTAHDPAGRWAKGNPGRPAGSRNKISSATLAAVKALYSEAVGVVRQRLAEGDLAAARIVLDVVLPKGGRLIELDTTDPLAVADALAMGEISPDEADKIASSLAKLQNVHEIDELRRRLDEIEAVVAERKR